jgi:hypothetical protein
MDAKKAELEIQNQVMKINRQVSNIVYTEKVFSSIMKDYDAGDHAIVIAEVILHIINKIKKLSKQQIPPHVIFATGVIILQRLQIDIADTGRAPLTEQESTKAIQYALDHYLKLYQHEFDMVEVGKQLKDMQRSLADGNFAKKVAPMLKADPAMINNVINGKPAVQPGMLQGGQ